MKMDVKLAIERGVWDELLRSLWDGSAASPMQRQATLRALAVAFRKAGDRVAAVRTAGRLAPDQRIEVLRDAALEDFHRGWIGAMHDVETPTLRLAVEKIQGLLSIVLMLHGKNFESDAEQVMKEALVVVAERSDEAEGRRCLAECAVCYGRIGNYPMALEMAALMPPELHDVYRLVAVEQAKRGSWEDAWATVGRIGPDALRREASLEIAVRADDRAKVRELLGGEAEEAKPSPGLLRTLQKLFDEAVQAQRFEEALAWAERMGHRAAGEVEVCARQGDAQGVIQGLQTWTDPVLREVRWQRAVLLMERAAHYTAMLQVLIDGLKPPGEPEYTVPLRYIQRHRSAPILKALVRGLLGTGRRDFAMKVAASCTGDWDDLKQAVCGVFVEVDDRPALEQFVPSWVKSSDAVWALAALLLARHPGMAAEVAAVLLADDVPQETAARMGPMFSIN
ncbi:MAG TPA: hypothetical protein VGO93_29415 [Candidatus Xenobia bacterium]|jgi:hypothetical protein